MSGRIRSIKPEVLEDERACALSDAAWRLWVSMWVLADDHGNCRAGTRYLASHVWQDSSRDAEPVLGELAAAGMIDVYEVGGQRYAHIRGWAKHQRVDNAGKPRVPMLSDPAATRFQWVSGRFAEIRGEVRELPLEPPKPPLDHDHRPTTTTAERGARAGDASPPATGSPTGDAILAALREHPPLAVVATAEFASVLDGRQIAAAKRIEWVVAAIAKAAADTPPGETEQAIRRRVRAFCDRASAADVTPPAPRGGQAPAASPPPPLRVAELPPVLSPEAKRAAALAAEAKLREALSAGGAA